MSLIGLPMYLNGSQRSNHPSEIDSDTENKTLSLKSSRVIVIRMGALVFLEAHSGSKHEGFVTKLVGAHVDRLPFAAQAV